MNLDADKLKRLNDLLASSNLDVPSFRKKVDVTGSNVKWLQKHLLKRNPGAPQELLSLLRIKSKPNGKQEEPKQAG